MPNYDYKCDGCQYTFEVFQFISKGPKRKCPKCGKFKLKRLIGGGSGIVFKGDGFWRSKNYEKGKKIEEHQ